VSWHIVPFVSRLALVGCFGWFAGNHNDSAVFVDLNAPNIKACCEYSLRSPRDISFFERARAAHLDLSIYCEIAN
jgi:hypothetical protein